MFYETISENLEMLQEAAIIELKESLEGGRLINLNVSPSDNLHLGDSLILTLPLLSIIRRYALVNGFPPPTFNFIKKGSHSDKLLEIIINGAKHFSKNEDDIKNVVLFTNASLVRNLNISFPKRLIGKLEKVPDHPWLDSFSRIKVEKRKQDFINTHQGEVAVIAQTGSSDIKRWSVDQLKKLSRDIKKNENLTCVIISDALLRGNEEEIKLLKEFEKEEEIEVVFMKSLDDLAVYTGVADYFFSTDSGPAWIWSAERKDEGKALIHHVITNKYWQAPGADIYTSDAVKEGSVGKYGFLVNKDPKEHSVSSIIYQKFYSVDNLTAPAERDFNEYLETATKFIQ